MRIISGNFNVETFWEEARFACVPRVHDVNTDIVNEGMQELLCAFCAPEDILLTRQPFHPQLKQYLESVGLSFQALAPDAAVANAPVNEDICALAQAVSLPVPAGATLSLFGALPAAAPWAAQNNVLYPAPDIEIVKKVNSKLFSHRVRTQLGLAYDAEIAESETAFTQTAERLLSEKGGYYVKEPMGVSGKGNFLVNSERLHRYFMRHLQKQLAKGKEISFLLEEILPKQTDFSCVAEIQPNGETEILGVQKISVTNTAYTGTQDCDAALTELLEKTAYHHHILRACRAYYEAGYYGYLCFDSLCTTHNTVVPIVEVNARCSMSQIKLALDNRFKQAGMFSLLGQSDIVHQAPFNISDLLASDFIYQGKTGVLPLSANALYSPCFQQEKGRLYYYILAETAEALYAYEQQLTETVKA